jgi:hypothetical protein
MGPSVLPQARHGSPLDAAIAADISCIRSTARSVSSRDAPTLAERHRRQVGPSLLPIRIALDFTLRSPRREAACLEHVSRALEVYRS